MLRALLFIPVSAALIFAVSKPALKAEKKPAVDVFAEAKDKTLRWRFAEGEILELKKFSDQVIKVGRTSEKRSVFHRVLLEAKAPDATRGFPLEGTFTSLIRGLEAKAAYTETEKFTGSFVLAPDGQFTVEKNQYMPNIRSVPAFPADRDPSLKDDAAMDQGATWEHAGEEVMRFANLVTVPFNVRYEYRGLENVKSEQGEKNCHKFISNYELNYGDTDAGGPRVFGYVTAVWFWDATEGIPYYSQEEYNVIIVAEGGQANEFKIKSRSYYRKFRGRNLPDKIKLTGDLQQKLNKPDSKVTVRAVENGVSISLPDVFFTTDSAKLSGDAKDELEQIGKMIKENGAKQIRVRGHTDSTGDAEYNQKLSEKRAETVADFLLDRAELNQDSVSFDGRGSKEPVAENGTADGRAKNRRVEIILLDK